jgi:hypothetical protein
LARRFFEVLRARPLTPAEQAEVAGWLLGRERELFWEQAVADQRHAYEVARRTRDRLGPDQIATRAALLHDVGKRHVRIGAVGRTLATVAGAARLPLTERWRRYRDHEARGAADLEAIGADPLVVAFARRPDSPPEGVEAARWEALVAADDA